MQLTPLQTALLTYLQQGARAVSDPDSVRVARQLEARGLVFLGVGHVDGRGEPIWWIATCTEKGKKAA